MNEEQKEIPIRNFENDLKTSNKPETRKSWEFIFKKIFEPEIEINWKDDNISQLEFGSDILIKTKKGRKYSIDVKTRRNEYFGWENYVIEIAHHVYSDKTKNFKIKTKEGWLYCSTSDFIFYGTLNKEGTNIIEVCGFSLTPFKNEEFKTEISNLKNKWASTEFSNGHFQLTLCKQVSLQFLKDNADKFWFFKGV